MEIIELLNFLWDIIIGLVFIYIFFKVADAIIDDFIADRDLKYAKERLISKKAWAENEKIKLLDNINSNLSNFDINFNVIFNDDLGDEYEEE